MCHNQVHLTPRSLPYQQCEEFRLTVLPEPVELAYRTDYFGNQVAHFSIDQPHRGLTVTATSHVRAEPRAVSPPSMSPPWEDVTENLRLANDTHVLDACQYGYASPYIQPFGELAEYCRESFPRRRPIVECVTELTQRIFDDFKYDPRATTLHTPLREVFTGRHGVCQDFAHLQIGCLRAIGLAARYVSGYLRTMPPEGEGRLVGADASHAWLSVYCGTAGWLDVDPTNNMLVSDDHITVAWGRDYDDVCPIQGVIVGGGEHRMNVSVDVAPQSEL